MPWATYGSRSAVRPEGIAMADAGFLVNFPLATRFSHRTLTLTQPGPATSQDPGGAGLRHNPC